MSAIELPATLFSETLLPKLKRFGMKSRQLDAVNVDLVVHLNNLKRLHEECNRIAAWLEFQRSEQPVEYGSSFQVYRIDDGEFHWIAARCEMEAIECHYQTIGYGTLAEYTNDYGDPEIRVLPPDVGLDVRQDEDSSKVEIKTAAAWAKSDSDEPFIIASTVN